MKSYLIDSHIFLWWMTDGTRLNSQMRDLLTDANNIIYISICSAWEIALKQEKRPEFIVKVPIEELFSESLFRILPIKLDHIVNIKKLPSIHKDPFDRLLVAQAISEELILLTNDRQLQKYPVEIITC